LQKHQEDQWNMIWWYLDYWEHNCDDETLPIINKPKHPKKRENTSNKKEGPTSKRVNHKGNIKFPNRLWLQDAYQIRKGENLFKWHLSLEEPSLIATTRLKIEIACACCNIVDTLRL
jgi:hypothetical protein